MDVALSDWLDAHGRPSAASERSASFSAEMERQLQDLGYL
jgi:hypothetical protein